MSYKDGKGPFKYTTCAICGKQYIKAPGSIYKVNFAGKTYQCCTYSCYMKAKRLKEDNNEASYKRFSDELKNR